MPNLVLYAHGGRGAGTATGTYVIPRGVTVYFFEKDKEFLYDSAAKIIMNTLLSAHPNELAVQGISKESKGQFESIPNYEASGDPNIAGMGVYLVGTPMATGQLYAIPYGTTKRISEIIGGSGSGGVAGNVIYWLACRDAKGANSNNFQYQTKDTVMTTTGAINLNAETVVPDTGLKPSIVRASGTWR